MLWKNCCAERGCLHLFCNCSAHNADFALAVAIAPGSRGAALLDFIGSLIVAAYLTWCGLRTVWEECGKGRVHN